MVRRRGLFYLRMLRWHGSANYCGLRLGNSVCVENENENGLTCVPDGESSCSVGEGLESVTYADGEKWYDVEGCYIFECDDGTIQQIVMDCLPGTSYVPSQMTVLFACLMVRVTVPVSEGTDTLLYVHGEKWYDVESCSIFECDDGTIQQL